MLKDMTSSKNAKKWTVRKYNLEEDYNRLKSAKRYKISWISDNKYYWICNCEEKCTMLWNSYEPLIDDKT